jgi:hypothetical protein
MAARDDFYRPQKTLNIVFSLSCVAMFVTMIWMFWADYAREYKVWQRQGFDVEVALLEERIKAFDAEFKDRIRVAEDRVRAQFGAMDAELVKEFDEARLRSEGVTFMDKARRLLNVVADSRIKEAQAELTRIKPVLVKETDRLSAEKALEGSLISFRDIMLTLGVKREALAVEEEKIRVQSKLVSDLEIQVQNLKREQDRLLKLIEDSRARVTEAVNDLGAVMADRDRQARQIAQKEYGFWSKFRAMPIMDAFASPYRIQQHTPDGLTIDYNFKYVQRVDRCATCHIFIERSGFSKEDLAKLAAARHPDVAANDPSQPKAMKLNAADINVYANHPRLDLFVGSNSPHSAEKFGCTVCHSGQGGSTSFNFAYHFPDDGIRYELKPVKKKVMKNGKEVTIDALEPVPVKEAYSLKEGMEGKRHRWEKDHGWMHDLHPNFLWEYPMLPQRFVESSCIKCHHQVTDLISTDGREQAPKLLKGYRLLRDNGCFACHEIHGWKGGQQVGPDMRLEPSPAPDEVTAQERAKMFADPSDPPGQLRKNGPGLRRVAEKSSPDWMEKWIRSPRSFRPETKMPHFFGQQNNHPTQLSDYQPGQSQLPKARQQGHPDMSGFPDAEVRAMAYYLHKSSESHLGLLRQVSELREKRPDLWALEMRRLESFRQISLARDEGTQKAPRRDEQVFSDDAPVAQILRETTGDPAELAKLSAADRDKREKEMEAKRTRLTKDQLRMVLEYYADLTRMSRTGKALSDRPYPPPELANFQPDPKRGEKYFELKGCLACHSHEAVRDNFKPADKDDPKAKTYDDLHQAHFGPPLTGLREKLGFDKNADQARKWVYYWLTEPADYHPRTNMPNPRLEPGERADIAAWLLQDRGNAPAPVKPDANSKVNNGVHPPALWWDDVQVGKGDVDGLLKTYLQKALPTRADVDAAMGKGLLDVSYLRADADERIFTFRPAPGSMAAMFKEEESEQRKLYYLGKKSIGKYGCFSCHDIPGFEGAKPIGTPLNDWGKKDPERLAFDNVKKYLDEHKKSYDPFYRHALEGHPGRRDGFLYQKLTEPRSYDYEKYGDRPWDDRLKMPQFRYAHTYRLPGEADDAFQKRAAQEEHDAREAIMTFVLGLTAEPISRQHIYQPRDDRKYEVRGIQVLEKYNCVGCHTVKPGVFETNLNTKTADGSTLEEQMQRQYGKTDPVPISTYPYYPESNVWKVPPGSPDGRVLLKGLPSVVDPDTKETTVQLWEAAPFRWTGEDMKAPDGRVLANKGGWASLPASFGLTLPANAKAHPAYGGLYTGIHESMLQFRYERELAVANRRSSAPPVLMRQGQRTQPQWLHQFLRQPINIRPAVYRHLKMPRFNISDDDAEALVNYFTAVDRLTNPGLKLDYFTTRPPQQDPHMQRELRQMYLERLHSAAGLKPGEAKNGDQDYFSVGWKVLTDKEACLKCHQLGNYVPEGDLSALAPSLHMAPERLRPDYVERWAAHAPRTIPYTFMPEFPLFYIPSDYKDVEKAMQTDLSFRARTQLAPGLAMMGNPLNALSAPLLLNQPFYNELQKGLTSEFRNEAVLEPKEKLWAVRDAVMSWGFLTQPPPIARDAGPRPDAYMEPPKP